MDKKAKQILFRTYWKNGWIDDNERNVSQEDFKYAKEKGLMFDPLSISHDDAVSNIITLRDSISEKQVVKAFLSSLSTRMLHLRSGIASWYLAQQIPSHTYTPVVSGHSYENGVVVQTDYTCGVCRDAKYGVVGREKYGNQDLNVLNFERIKWGGVRHGHLIYTLFDLKLFQSEEIPDPTQEDVELLKAILNIIETSAPNDYPSALRKRLVGIQGLKATKDELDQMMEILACIGILRPTSYDRPTSGKNDWTYVEFWRGEDKYDKVTTKGFFGEYLDKWDLENKY